MFKHREQVEPSHFSVSPTISHDRCEITKAQWPQSGQIDQLTIHARETGYACCLQGFAPAVWVILAGSMGWRRVLPPDLGTIIRRHYELSSHYLQITGWVPTRRTGTKKMVVLGEIFHGFFFYCIFRGVGCVILHGKGHRCTMFIHECANQNKWNKMLISRKLRNNQAGWRSWRSFPKISKMNWKNSGKKKKKKKKSTKMKNSKQKRTSALQKAPQSINKH